MSVQNRIIHLIVVEIFPSGKVVNQPTDIATPWATSLVWQAMKHNNITGHFSQLNTHFIGIWRVWNLYHKPEWLFYYLLRMGEYACLVNLPQGRNGRVASAAEPKLFSSPHPGTGSAHRSWEKPNSTVNMDGVFCPSLVCNVYICQWDRDLHSYTGTQLGNIFGFLELFAKSQKVHTERMTWKKKRQKNFGSHRYHRQFKKKRKIYCNSLLLGGEDFKAAVSKHLIKHLKERNGHPRKQEGKKRCHLGHREDILCYENIKRFLVVACKCVCK